MLRIFVCSPLKPREGNTFEDNVDLAKRLCQRVIEVGEAPFAPHIFYPLMLDDTKPEERAIGMNAAKVWLKSADELWVYNWLGVSEGMRDEIALADVYRIRVRAMPAPFLRVPPKRPA